MPEVNASAGGKVHPAVAARKVGVGCLVSREFAVSSLSDAGVWPAPSHRFNTRLAALSRPVQPFRPAVSQNPLGEQQFII